MKKLILLCLTVFLVQACQKNIEQPDYVVVNGQFSNSNGGVLTLLNLGGFKKEINVKDDGSFVDTLFVDNGNYTAYLEKNAIPMYFTKGAHIEVYADTKDVSNSLVFKGDNAVINNYYVFKAKIVRSLYDNMQQNCALDEESYLKLMDDTKSKLESELSKQTSIPEDVKIKERRAIDYFIQSQLGMYVDYRPYFTKEEKFEPSQAFKGKQKEFDLTKLEDYLYSQDYNTMVFRDVYGKGVKLAQKDSISNALACLKVNEGIANDTLRELLMARFAEMYFSITKEGNDKKEEYYQKYLALSKDPEQKQKIKDLYADLQLLAPGSPSPKFVNYENYAGGNSSLEDFKGKYVYIDVWATWCGPCKYEIPFLKEVEKSFEGKNIEFISISVDNASDHQKWKDMVAEKEMGGVQLFADAAFSSNFIKDYKIQGIPQFILLDPKGNIVNSQAPRPSEKELVNVLNSLNL